MELMSILQRKSEVQINRTETDVPERPWCLVSFPISFSSFLIAFVSICWKHTYFKGSRQWKTESLLRVKMGNKALILITFIEIVKPPRVVGLSPLAVALSFKFSVSLNLLSRSCIHLLLLLLFWNFAVIVTEHLMIGKMVE